MTSFEVGRARPWHLVAGATAAVLLIGVAVTVAALTGSGSGSDTSLALAEVPEGVSVADIEGESVFLVRAGDDVRALSPDARHMSGEVVWWCEASKIFWEDHHGSVFDAQGRKIGGPARGGLNRFETTLTGGEVVIDVEQVTQGELQPRGEWPRDAAGVRDGAPPTFCPDPLRP